MVPSAFVFLDALPVTQTGKVNRGLCSHWISPSPMRALSWCRPADTERAGRIWCRVLARQVSVQENFFDLEATLTSGDPGGVADPAGVQRRASIEHDSETTIESLAVYVVEQKALASDSADINALLAEVESLSDERAESEFRRLEGDGGTSDRARAERIERRPKRIV
jgi:hypothetical protein